jgi:ribosomal protein L3 glutamine methyltransferase
MTADTDALLSIRDFIRWATSRFNAAGLFFGHGTDNALDEAVQLLLPALHLGLDLPAGYLEARLTPSERELLLELIRRRVEERLPAAYLTGKAWFAGLEFSVDPQVLVPRSPIAELIEAQFQPWLEPERLHRVLDLCTGSGCIGIATALQLPEVEVDLADISAPALAVARRNRDRYGLEERVELIQSDLFAGLAGRRYDLILCNPPYVNAAELAGLPAEYHREPALGLAGGSDGLDLVRRILQQAPGFLAAGGAMILEVGSSADALMESYPEVPFLWLEFQRGGEGVCLLTAEQLQTFQPLFADEA